MDKPSAPYQSEIMCLLDRAKEAIEEQSRKRELVEVEHIVERSRDLIVRALADTLTVQPIVFDEARDRRLIRYGMIDVVRLRIGRNHEQRLTRAIAAAAVDRQALEADQSAGRRCAGGECRIAGERRAYAG